MTYELHPNTGAKMGDLLERLHNKQAQVAILGLGYVGLPLAVAFAEAGFSVTGIDPMTAR